MRASRNRLADDDDGARASDAERDQAIGELRERFAEGRLSQETFLYRMDAALRAKARSDLSGLFVDLPGVEPRLEKQPGLGQRISARLTLLKQAVIGPGLGGQSAGGQRAGGQSAGRQSASQPDAGWPGSGARPGPPPLWLPPPADRRFTIGRAMACDFTLADLSVSRWHARLYRGDDGWLLSDLGSTNGTRLNGWRVTTGVPVRPGDQVTFGSVTFVITDRASGTS